MGCFGSKPQKAKPVAKPAAPPKVLSPEEQARQQELNEKRRREDAELAAKLYGDNGYLSDKYKAEAAVEAAAAEAAEAELDKAFALFAKVDRDKSGTIDMGELAAALKENKHLRERTVGARLCKNTSVAFSPGDSMDVLAEKIITAADDDKDGVIQPVELERAIRGWIKVDYSKIADSKEKGRENELKGAAARAEIARTQGGGFAGLTDAEAALNIGKGAQERTGAEKAVFMESEPTVFAGGAHYQLAWADVLLSGASNHTTIKP